MIYAVVNESVYSTINNSYHVVFTTSSKEAAEAYMIAMKLSHNKEQERFYLVELDSSKC